MPTASNPAPLNLSGRIPELDGIRGLAIGMVLLWHYFVYPATAALATAAPTTALSYALVFGRLTWTGVDLFFVLSGFLIGGILLDARKAANYFQVFYTRRFFRIVPIYAALLLVFPSLITVMEWSHPGNFNWLTADALPWYSYWTFTQNFWMAAAATLGANALGITWSLAIEEQFYLTLPLLVRLLAGRRLLVCVLTGIFLAPLARITILHFWPYNWVAAFALMPCRAVPTPCSSASSPLFCFATTNGEKEFARADFSSPSRSLFFCSALSFWPWKRPSLLALLCSVSVTRGSRCFTLSSSSSRSHGPRDSQAVP